MKPETKDCPLFFISGRKDTMINLLVKIFVKNPEDIKNSEVRQSYGVLSGGVGICCNILLFCFKFLAGILTGAVSVAADAFNNLSDAGSSVITLVGFKMAGKPADNDHPFGHGRIEYISGLAVAVAIIVMGVELLRQSFDRILHPEAMAFSLLSVIILVGSILVKMWMAYFNYGLGKKIDSAAMKATATDSLSDCITTSVVLISVFVEFFTGFNIDGYAGSVVALFVLYAGYQAAKDTLAPLLGQAPDPELVADIERVVMEESGIIGIHDMIIHDYGPGRVFASLHAEVPYSMDILHAHDIIDLAESRVKDELGIEISIHMDPIVDDDEHIQQLKSQVIGIVREIDEGITIHDFRVVSGPYLTNMIFDCVVPFDCPLKDDEVKKTISDKVSQMGEGYNAVISIDKPMATKASLHPL